MMAGLLFNIFVVPSGKAWQHKVATDLCKRKGFRGGFGVDHLWLPSTTCFFPFEGTRQNVASSHSFRCVFGMASCLAKSRKKMFLVGSVVHLTMMVIFFGIALFLPFVELRNQPEFLPLLSKDRTRLAPLSSMARLASGFIFSYCRYSLGLLSSSDLASSCH